MKKKRDSRLRAKTLSMFEESSSLSRETRANTHRSKASKTRRLRRNVDNHNGLTTSFVELGSKSEHVISELDASNSELFLSDESGLEKDSGPDDIKPDETKFPTWTRGFTEYRPGFSQRLTAFLFDASEA